MMGGFSNNPTPYQFQIAIKSIVIHVSLVYSFSPNCTADSEIDVLILSVGCLKKDNNFEEGSLSETDDDFV